MSKKKSKQAKKAKQIGFRGYTNDTFKLFCYGTLNVHGIQEMLWNEQKQGRPAVLPGYELRLWKNSAIFYVVPKPGERVVGKIYELTKKQIEVTDTYETEAYERIRVEIGKEQVEIYVKAENRE